MKAFLVDLLRFSYPERFVVVIDPDPSVERMHTVRPRRLALLFVGVAVFGGLFLTALIHVTPAHRLLPGYVQEEIRSDARLAQARLATLEDSLDVYAAYVAQLRRIITGEFESPASSRLPSDEQSAAANAETEAAFEPLSENWSDHRQPAVPVTHLPANPKGSPRVVSGGKRYPSSFQVPALPPVTGFVSRGFEAQTGHYAIDIATVEGSLVRSVGDGYVILADWTQKGGYAIAVQHADGFVSVYKHNARLLKRVADRVSLREAVAVSGNSGEYTSGPHLHFELWNNGLAQDPRLYLLGL